MSSACIAHPPLTQPTQAPRTAQRIELQFWQLLPQLFVSKSASQEECISFLLYHLCRCGS